MADGAWIAITKLSAPNRRHDALRRSRLTDAFHRSITQNRITLLSAPAGAGKTTLLTELPSALPELHFCWLLLDSEDNDPSRFTFALIASIQAAKVLDADENPAPSEPRTQITFLINCIASNPSTRCVLVLDDLHRITEQSVLNLLDYLLDNAPPNCHVILATRHDPPLSLARRRARGEVGELRLDELNFTESEAGELISGCLGLALDNDEVSQLHSRTEGWAAGLRLLATSLSQFPGDRTVLQGTLQGSRQIFDFLANEVLDRQPAGLRSFLLETSILPQLRPDLCNALTGRTDSLSVLEDLYYKNLYVVCAAAGESTFRYHDLFADFLRDRLRRERPGDWQALHQKAAQAESFPQDRMRHLLAAEAWQQAVSEIESLGPELTRRGLVATLRRWIAELPEDVLAQHPRVLYLLGQAVWILSDFSEAQPYIERALEGFRRTNDHAGQAEATIALANSALVLNQLDRCRDLLKEALTFDIPPTGRIQLHTASVWEAIFRKDLTEAATHIDEIYLMVESGEGRTNPLSLLTVLFSEGIPGYVDRLDAMCRNLLPKLSSPPDFSHAFYHVSHCAVLVQRGDFALSESEAQLSLAIAHACGEVALIQAALCVCFCMIYAKSGDWKSVNHWTSIGCDESRHGQTARSWKLKFNYFQARACWHSGDLDGLRLAHESAMTPNPFDPPPVGVYRHLVQGMMHFAVRAYALSERSFREAMHEESEFQITRTNCSARVMLAYSLLFRGRADAAIDIFSPYLKENEDSNLPGRMMLENPIIQPLLRLAAERNIQRPFAEKVLAMLGAPLDAAQFTGVESLTTREMEVLRAMAEGLSNREIGSLLFVSEATVKTHVQRIFRKLASSSRTGAVARARELMFI